MKKFISLLAVLTLTLAMSITAFAAEATPSPTADDLVIKIVTSNEAPSAEEIGEGNKLLGAYDATLVHESTGAAATAEEVAAYIAAQGGSIVVDFSEYVGNVTPVKVLHKTGGAWKSESFTGAKVTTSSLSPFAFIVKADAASSTAAGTAKSPQTGYNTAMWAISAAMMALCAGYCLVSARKKTAE